MSSELAALKSGTAVISNPMRLPSPTYRTALGAAYQGDSFDLIRCIASDSVDLVITSPPFALTRKKEYGNKGAKDYVGWFLPLADEVSRILKPAGSFVIDLGGSWTPGSPTRNLYNFELLISLCRHSGFYLAQDFYWYNPAKLPSPAEWVTVRRIRVKDAVNPVWWLSKTPNPSANNRRVLQPYSQSMLDLLKNGYTAKLRPSGHDISAKFSNNHGGSIPPNLLSIANTESNGAYLRACREAKLKPHPARFPHGLPEFFIKFVTQEGDLILDPFAGSNVTGEVAERHQRKWIAFELSGEYLATSKFRFQREQSKDKKRAQKLQSGRLRRSQSSLF